MCPFQVHGLGTDDIDSGLGVDAIQALQMALEGVRVRLSREVANLKWFAGYDGDLGFPRLVPSFFGPAFADRLDKIISREVESFDSTSSLPTRTPIGRTRRKRRANPRLKGG
jgi:hypothetical protein